MKTSPLLNTCFAIAVAHFGNTACVARECTAEEQREVGATGADECKTYTPPEQHRGAEKVETVAYTSGANLIVRGDFRNLEIEAFPSGGSGEVEIGYRPVVDLAQGRDEDVVEATLKELDVSIDANDDAVTVVAKRSGESNVAAMLNIRIPDDFDGDIDIDQSASKNDGGEAELTFLGNAKNLIVDLNASGETLFVKGRRLESAAIQVQGFWEIQTEPFESPNFKGAGLESEHGDILTGFAAIPSSLAATVKSEDGDITVRLPGEGDYTMQAASPDFTFGARIPSSCSEVTNAGGGSLTCGAGSEDKKLDFQMETEGKIDIPGFLALVE